MSNEKSKTEETVREMAKLSMLSNKISEVQEKNLKMFPFVFFDDITEVKIDYDLSNDRMVDSAEDTKSLEVSYAFGKAETSHLRVSYYLTIDESSNTMHLDRRFAAIEASVRALFWKETKVEVYLNGRKAFESKNGGK